LNRPRERAFKQFKCPRPQCVKIAADFLEFTAEDKCLSIYTAYCYNPGTNTTFVQNLDDSNLLSLTARSRYS